MNGITTQSTCIDVTSDSVTQRITEAVTKTIDADPLELEPLYETIDPDALEQLFATNVDAESDLRSRIVFTYAGCEVTVYGNGEIEVTQQTDEQADIVIGEVQHTIQSN